MRISFRAGRVLLRSDEKHRPRVRMFFRASTTLSGRRDEEFCRRKGEERNYCSRGSQINLVVSVQRSS